MDKVQKNNLTPKVSCSTIYSQKYQNGVCTSSVNQIFGVLFARIKVSPSLTMLLSFHTLHDPPHYNPLDETIDIRRTVASFS
jgi:hypothetical protein